MNSETVRRNIEANLQSFDPQQLRESATAFLNNLGYCSKMVGNDGIDSDRFNRLIASALETANPSDKLSVDDWKSFYQILQVRDNEIKG